MSATNHLTEQQLKDRIEGQVFEKVTLSMMQSRIKAVDYRFHDTLTICIITLDNGYKVTGESACVDPRNFDQDIGASLAYNQAVNKLWPLFGFLLAENVHQRKIAAAHAP